MILHEDKYIEFLQRRRLIPTSVASYLSTMRAVEKIVRDITPDILHSEEDVQRIVLRLGQEMHPNRIRNCGTVMRRYIEMVKEYGLWQAVPDTDTSLETEMITHGIVCSAFVPDKEGRKLIRLHVKYERSKRNRAEAIRIQGAKCKVCEFDFNVRYGREHARDYIEVHHVRSVAEQEGREIDPSVDLVPLCSNCHSMAHREIGRVRSIAELTSLIANGQA